MLDTFAVMLAGSVQPVCQSAAQAIESTYGSGSSFNKSYTALDGTNSSLSGQMFLTSLAAGDFEFEHIIEGAHPASAMFPTLLCVADAHHKTGEDLLAAMAIGYGFATRIGAATTLTAETVKGFHIVGSNGDLATAAAVGNLLNYDADTIASAMGIAASSSGGLQAYISTGAMTRRLYPARAGQLGAEAAFQADAGIEGPRDVLENLEGYLHAFSHNPKPELMTTGLGKEWMSAQQTVKLAPVHAWAQVYVHAINLSTPIGKTTPRMQRLSRTSLSMATGHMCSIPIPGSPTLARSRPHSIVSHSASRRR